VKRAIVLACLALVALAGCSQPPRPEGVVQRWLVSLNQGVAGQPDRWADAGVTTTVAPWWPAEPDHIDAMDVGAATGNTVPFRIETTDGTITTGIATVGTRPTSNGTAPYVASVSLGDVPVEAHKLGELSGAELAAAAGVGIVLAIAAVGVLTLVRRSTGRA
jgi:hypothetical protein